MNIKTAQVSERVFRFHSASLSEIRKRVNFQRAFVIALQRVITVSLYKKSKEPPLTIFLRCLLDRFT